MKRGLKNKKGFTLVEIIVVLVILAILASMLIPSMTGWIDKGMQKTAIVGCRTCVIAAQTLASERYASDGAGNVIVSPDETLALARLEKEGVVNSVSIAVPAVVDTLTYTDTASGITVTYLRLPQPHYEFDTGTAGASASFGGLAAAFGKLQSGQMTEANGNVYKGGKIDGVNVGAANGPAATALYNALPASQQAFLSTVSWSIVQTTVNGQKLYRIYFTEQRYEANSGTVTNAKVYKYDMATGKYQAATNGKVVNGEVQPVGSWGEWSDTMGGA